MSKEKKRGRPKKYGEPTEHVTFRVPKSKTKQFRKLGNKLLCKYKGKDKQLKPGPDGKVTHDTQPISRRP